MSGRTSPPRPSRVVAAALHALALKYANEGAGRTRRRLRLGRVVLIGSDIDRARTALFAADGMLQVFNVSAAESAFV